MKPLREYNLAEKGKQLWGHSLGREVRLEIESELENLARGGVFKIQLKGIEVMDFSFSNEVFGKIYSTIGTIYPERAIVLANLTEYVKINLDAALASLGFMAVTVKGKRDWEVIGKVGDTDIQTLEVIANKKQVTAPEVAEILNIKLTTCNQRLRKLTENGLILRAKESARTGGEQFIYTWPV
jgi:hypothetical protein